MNKFIQWLVSALVFSGCIGLNVNGQTLYPGESATVICMPLPTPKPAPAPVPTQAPTHSSLQTVEFACSMYGQGKRTVAGASQINYANKVRANCSLVLTWWEVLPSYTWCPYIRQNSIVEYCGPYNNWGYIISRDDPYAYDLGGDIYNKYIIPNYPEWILRNSAGRVTANQYNPVEVSPDHGNMEFVDFYMDYFKQVPSIIYNARWKGTYRDRDWNLVFLDNFLVNGLETWTNVPVDPRTGKAMTREDMEGDMLNAAKRLRVKADKMDVKLFANIWSDVEAEYFNRPIYPQLVDYLDYGLFETWTYKIDGTTPESEAVWLRRIKTAQDMIKNRRAEPVVSVKLGNFWYALSSLLLVRENGRGMAWMQVLPSDDVLERARALNLGEPLEDYHKKGGVYQREWTKGKVVVNPSDSASYFVPLDGNYKDVETGKTVQGVTLPPKTGKILVKQ